MITVVLADDHEVVRQGLMSLLEGTQDIRVVAEAGTGLDALAAVEHLRPDVAVVDIGMADMNGIEVTREITKNFPKTRVVILSMYDTPPYVDAAIDAGAVGYVAKKSSAAMLADAIRAAYSGKRFFQRP